MLAADTDMTQAQLLRFVILALIVLPILYLRVRRMARTRELKPGMLFVFPAVVVVLAVLALFAPQPGQGNPGPLTPEQWAWLGLAVLLGAAAGWYFGRIIAIEVHPEKGTLMAKGSAAAVMVIVVLVVVKLGLQPFLAMEGSSLNLDVRVITDASIIFSAALFVVRALEMYLRAKNVMAQAGR